MFQHKRIATLILVGFATYFSSFGNQFVWDDEQFIYKNEYVKNFAVARIFSEDTTAGAGIVSNYYRPLTTLSFAVDYAIWGERVVGWHLVNTSLHVAAGLLLFLILQRLTSSQNMSMAIAVLFLIHPVQTEAVTYVNSRGDSLYTFFLMLGVYCFVRFVEGARPASGGPRSQSQLITTALLGTAAFVCYPLSILSKEIGIAGFGLYLLTLFTVQFQHYLRTHKHFSWAVFLKKHLWQSWGWFILYLQLGITITYLILRSTILNFTGNLNLYDGTEYGASLIIRLLTFSKVFLQYIGLLFWPHPLYMDRQPELVTSVASPFPWLFLLVQLTAIVIGIYTIVKKKQPLPLIGWFWFVGMLMPVSGILPINGLMYEHWLYVPQIGFWLFLFSSLWMFVDTQSQRTAVQKILKPAFAVWCVVLIALTIRQNFIWSTPIRLYTHLIQHTDTSRIYNNLAMAYADAGETEHAIATYQHALTLSTAYPQTYHNLANAYKTTGQFELAAEYYQQALDRSPEFYFSRIQLVEMLLENGEASQAADHVRYLEQQFPNNQQIKDYRAQITN